MRPRRLKIKGLTSFRDEQEIDFTDLELFALWGPMGSGKSSILDAITYALYGKVERVGNEPRQLVSQGQPRMTVEFDFAVGNDDYRVTRSTRAAGASGETMIRLERRAGDAWLSYGPGADQVRTVNKTIKEIVGLDYEAFTRSVILPQGKFAEFLAGDAAERRRILTELLGLELFKKMAQRSNEIWREAKALREANQGVLEREYADVDDDAVKRAKVAVKQAKKLAGDAGKVEERIAEAGARWDEEANALRALEECTSEAERLAGMLGKHAEALETHARSLTTIRAARADAETTAERALAAATAATSGRTAAESQWGGLERLAVLLQNAAQLAKRRADAASAKRSLDEATERLAQARAEVAATAELLEQATRELAAAEKDLLQERDRHARAHDHDKVASLVVELSAGDPCPVCARPLERLPDVSPDLLEQAKITLKSAEDAYASAQSARNRAEADHRLAQQAVNTEEANVERCSRELQVKHDEVAELSSALSEVFDGSIPADAEAALTEATAQLRRLVADEQAAHARAEEAKKAVVELDRTIADAEGAVREIRAALVHLDVTTLAKRLDDVGWADDSKEIRLPGDPPDEAAALAAAARERSTRMQQLGERLRSEMEVRAERRETILVDVRASIPTTLAIDGDDLQSLRARARVVAEDLRTTVIVSERELQTLSKRATKRRELEAEIERHRVEHALYQALSKELRDDRIVQFLQAEALSALATSASEHLRQLSVTRYKLMFENEEFFVVDSWNGDERRSVKTLSGGETFLASLALALGLSEQVQLLAVSQRGKLESLFLDEGFGTLDAETLEVVVGALEQLGGEQRIVGVITHVAEVANRMPVRLDVVKSPRGSRIVPAVAELQIATAG